MVLIKEVLQPKRVYESQGTTIDVISIDSNKSIRG